MKSIIAIFSVLIFLLSCNSPSRETLLQNVSDAESAFNDKSANAPVEKVIENAINAYEAFAKAFPKDSLTPEYLFNAAKYYRSSKKPELAIEKYNLIIDKFPQHNKAPYSQFLKGFIYENELEDLDKAKDAYETFLLNYPDHDLSGDVKFSLDNLGKPLEQIIKEFEMKQQDAAAQDIQS